METSPSSPTEEIEQQEVIDTQPIAQITHVDIRFNLALAVPAGKWNLSINRRFLEDFLSEIFSSIVVSY